MSSYRLHVQKASFHTFSALIAAEYNAVDIEVSTDQSAAALSPNGKLPLLEVRWKNGDSALIFSWLAIARHIAGIRSDSGLMGTTVSNQATIEGWLAFATQDLEPPSSVLFLPLTASIPYSAEAHGKAKQDLAAGLGVLQKHLQDKTYLVGDDITLADIAVASTLLYPFKLVCDKPYLQPFDHVQRWFATCVNQPEFLAVVGQVTMCKKEMKVAGQES